VQIEAFSLLKGDQIGKKKKVDITVYFEKINPVVNVCPLNI